MSDIFDIIDGIIIHLRVTRQSDITSYKMNVRILLGRSGWRMDHINTLCLQFHFFYTLYSKNIQEIIHPFYSRWKFIDTIVVVLETKS